MEFSTPHRCRKEIKLFEERGDTNRFINACIDENGDLSVEGQDVGEAPLKIWGDIDYEFKVQVTREDKPLVMKALLEYCAETGISKPFYRPYNLDESIMKFIKKIYNGHFSAVDEFRDLMEAKGVPHDFLNWA